jgi:hypothetical protein
MKSPLAWLAVSVFALAEAGAAFADVPRRGPYTGCGEIAARWDAPRGALVLIDSGGNSAVKPIINAIGETYTHEMVVESADAASESELLPPTGGTCNYPLSVQMLTYGYPGMQRSMNMGAVYANIYGGVPFSDSGSIAVIWQLGDVQRANAIADVIQSTSTVDVQVLIPYYDRFLDGSYSLSAHTDQCQTICGDPTDPTSCRVMCGDYIHRMIRNGDVSPYSLHQYYDIEDTHLGGGALRNGSVSSTYCSYAYALGSYAVGALPMTPFLYGHEETQNAGYALANSVYATCRNGLGWFERLICGGTQTVCERAANMVLNCMRLGDCNNNTAIWQSFIDQDDARARTVSPDRLGGHSARFAQEVADGNPPTTWATDTVEHDVQWNAAGTVFGCFR